jgi:hypothetical protein
VVGVAAGGGGVVAAGWVPSSLSFLLSLSSFHPSFIMQRPLRTARYRGADGFGWDRLAGLWAAWMPGKMRLWA